MICIYAIINIVDDKHYVGQANDRDLRWREHRKSLRGFYHHSILLQRAWCKHGEHNFIFMVLEVLNSKEQLNEREIHWGRLLNPEYNIAPMGGGMRGYKHTEEARQNMSDAHKGYKASPETRAKMSEQRKGNKFAAGQKHTPERIEARAKLHRGKIISEETRLKMSEAAKGRVVSTETRDKMRAAKVGKNLSDEHRKKLSDAAKKQWERQLTSQQFLNNDSWKSSWSD